VCNCGIELEDVDDTLCHECYHKDGECYCEDAINFVSKNDINKMIIDFNKIKHPATSIEPMTDFNHEYEFHDESAIAVISAEYRPSNVNPIYYDTGNKDIFEFIIKYRLNFNWVSTTTALLYKSNPHRICCGKYCEENINLKKGMGWNKWHLRVETMITEQIYCPDCYDQYTSHKCMGCTVVHNYTDMDYKEGGIFGEPLYGYDQFYCKPCVSSLEKKCLEYQ